jgi:hypothetical protein
MGHGGPEGELGCPRCGLDGTVVAFAPYVNFDCQVLIASLGED